MHPPRRLHISGHSSVTTTLMSAYTSLGELSQLSQQDFVQDNSTATFNYSVLSNHYATQLTELATIQHKLEVVQATTIQHPNSSNHNSRIAYSALAISVAAIIILSCSMILLKKAPNSACDNVITYRPKFIGVFECATILHASIIESIFRIAKEYSLTLQITNFDIDLITVSKANLSAIVYVSVFTIGGILQQDLNNKTDPPAMRALNLQCLPTINHLPLLSIQKQNEVLDKLGTKN
uniref:Uncharacterized protein n=1 Tax=Glossina austeni TaxID=7395 RepID=A0A1A9UZ80_GLOAU